jgi:Flp pilus assembly protein TadG
MKRFALRLRRRPNGGKADQRGQALIEFAVAVVPFLMLLMGVIDLGRGIYMANATSEAAREIARVTSVHPANLGSEDLGTSTETQGVVATQRGLLPGMTVDGVTGIVCVDVTDTVKADSACVPGDYVRVTISAPFQPATPLVMMFGSRTFDSTSRIKLEAAYQS